MRKLVFSNTTDYRKAEIPDSKETTTIEMIIK